MTGADATDVLGPKDGRLLVHTRREGAAAKAGHDLDLEVRAWRAEVVRDPAGGIASVSLTADPDSLEVVAARGGLKPLGELEKREIHRNVESKVLQGRRIAFASERVEERPGGLRVAGRLSIGDVTRPLALELTAAGARLDGSVRLRQTDWAIKPYSALLGALKLRDEVELSLSVAVSSRFSS